MKTQNIDLQSWSDVISNHNNVNRNGRYYDQTVIDKCVKEYIARFIGNYETEYTELV